MLERQSPKNPVPLPMPSAPLFQVLKRTYLYLKPYWKHTAGAYIALLAVLAINTFIPQIIRWIIDTGIQGNQPRVLPLAVLLLLGLTLVKGVLTYFQGLFTETASQNVAFDLRNEIQKKLTQLSFSFHDQAETGELLSRAVQDVERVRFLTGRATLRILEGGLMLVITAVILLTMDFKLALMILVTMPLLVFQAVRFGTRFRPLSLQVQKQLALLTTGVEQNLRGSRVVKAYAQEEAEIERFSVTNDEWFRLSNRSAKMQAVNAPLLFLIANLGMVAIIVYGGHQVIQGSLSIGVVVAFISYVGQLVDPVRRLGMIIPAVAIAGSASERIYDILDVTSEVTDSPGALRLKKIEGRVRFEDVSFDFGKNKILRNVSFDALPGQKIALLGLTGSGKSSIINLIPRFYDPTGGRILVDETDIRDVTLKSLRSQIGVVAQDVRPGAEAESDAALLAVAKATGGTVYHPSCTVRMGGDAAAPGLIAHAVHDGHRAAREMFGGETRVLRERVILSGSDVRRPGRP